MLLHDGFPNQLNIDFSENHKYREEIKPHKDLIKVLYTRYVSNVDGTFLTGNKNESFGSIFWAEKSNNHDFYIVYSHEPIITVKPKFINKTINIDGCCVYGGGLHSLILDGTIVNSLSVESKYCLK